MKTRFYGSGLEISLTLFSDENITIESVICCNNSWTDFIRSYAPVVYHEFNIRPSNKRICYMKLNQTILEHKEM